MVLRKHRLDPGFTNTAPEIIQPVKEESVSMLTQVGDLLTSVGALPISFRDEAYQKRVGGAWGAAYQMDNDVMAVVDLATRPIYIPDPTFNIVTKLKESGYWDEYRDNFVGVQSEQEFNAVAQRIVQENTNRATLKRSGLTGLVASVFAGLTSPTMLIPFVGQARGLKAVVQGAALTGLAGVAQEVPLQMAQETRTLGESVSSIAMSTVLGGVLGGAVGFIGRGRNLEEVARQWEADMVDGAVPSYVSPLADVGQGSSVGAFAVERSAGRMAGALGQEDQFLANLSPVTRTVAQDTSGQGQYMMAQLADAGVRLEGNKKGVATAQGGTAENRIKTYYARVADSVRLLDDAYARYWFGGDKPGMAAAFRANVAQLSPFKTQMSKAAFKAEVSRALRNGDQHEVPEVAETAAFIRQNVYEPLLERARKAGLYSEIKTNDSGEIDVVGDESYLNRDYKTSAIEANPTKFVQILAQHYEAKLQEQFKARVEKFIERAGKDQTLIEDLARTEEETAKLRAAFEAELNKMDTAMSPEEVDMEDYISSFRSLSRDKKLTDAQRKDARDMVKALELKAGPDRVEKMAKRRELQRRLRNLNKSITSLAARQRAKLDRIDAIEVNSLASLQRAVRAARKSLDKMDRLTDAEFAKEIVNLRNKFEDAGQLFDRYEERLSKLGNAEGDTIDQLLATEAKQSQTAERMNRLLDQLEETQALDPEAVRAVLNELMDEALVKVNHLNGRRFARAERLKEQAAALDPKLAQQRIVDTQAEMRARREKFTEEFRLRGADDIDIVGGAADFRKFAEESARTVMHHILGTHMRLPGFDLIGMERGAELKRVLDLPSDQIEEFLENDVEKLVMKYVRTLAPDIEIRTKLGEFAPDKEKNPEWKKLQEEQDAKAAALDAELTAKGASPEAKAKAQTELANQYKAIRRDLEAVIGRLRGTWGIPPNPSGFAARAARVAMNLNVLRFMGSTLLSSVPDIARPIQKYGLGRTFRDGYLPLIRNFEGMKLTARELRLAGAALDIVLHSRAHQIHDIGDYMVRGSKFEKALEFATSKVGLVNVFDIWTTGMKQIAGSVANAKLMDSLDMVVNLNGGMRETAKAMEYLASAGIDNNLAGEIWRQVLKAGGGEKVNGVWWPNTEAWDNAGGAVDAYRAALVKEVDDTIITPGVERPLWMDSSLTGRLLGQFKSFGMSSSSKTVLAGLQQRDMAVLNGTLFSLALGTLSYYIWAQTVGGQALDEMNAALNDLDGEGWQKFADEAISRSGNLAILGEVQDFLASFQQTAPYVTFSGEKTTRRAGSGDWLDVFGGPSADAVKTAGQAVTDMLGEGGASRAGIHKLRTLLPLQNNFYLRKLFDAVENAVGDTLGLEGNRR